MFHGPAALAFPRPRNGPPARGGVPGAARPAPAPPRAPPLRRPARQHLEEEADLDVRRRRGGRPDEALGAPLRGEVALGPVRRLHLDEAELDALVVAQDPLELVLEVVQVRAGLRRP